MSRKIQPTEASGQISTAQHLLKSRRISQKVLVSLKKSHQQGVASGAEVDVEEAEVVPKGVEAKARRSILLEI